MRAGDGGWGAGDGDGGLGTEDRDGEREPDLIYSRVIIDKETISRLT